MKMISAHMLQAVILTKNEDSNIERVLRHLRWIERIIVVDSFSTDRTEQIVKSFTNTEWHTRTFDTHATQWNYGLQQANSEWILSLDADYILPEAFADEVLQKIEETDITAFDAQFHFLVFGKALRGNNTMPRPVLFRRTLCSYYDDGHTQRLRIDGKTGSFANKIDHDDRKPLSRWLMNQAAYSIKEKDMLTNTPDKDLSFTSKLRTKKVLAPFFVFFYSLFVKGLILDGWRGWYYTLQRTIVEMLFALRLIEHDSFRDMGNK